jgi:hypothetical protein
VELRSLKERCYEKSVACVQKIKTSFANIGAYSKEDNFVLGDPEGPIEWINGEAEAFEEVLSGRGDVCWDHASSPKVPQKETASAEAVCT